MVARGRSHTAPPQHRFALVVAHAPLGRLILMALVDRDLIEVAAPRIEQRCGVLVAFGRVWWLDRVEFCGLRLEVIGDLLVDRIGP